MYTFFQQKLVVSRIKKQNENSNEKCHLKDRSQRFGQGHKPTKKNNFLRQTKYNQNHQPSLDISRSNSDHEQKHTDKDK